MRDYLSKRSCPAALITSLVLAGCSSGAARHGATGPNIATGVAAPAEEQHASFAAVGSEPILAAAMTYPEALIAEEPAPPMSLTASDGTGLRLVSLDGRAVIDGPIAFTELLLRFENPQDRVIEGRFAITLPESAAISRLAMRLDSGWQEAEVVERQLARRAYEDFLHRRQDPALLEKEAGNEFRARIFPIPARGTKEIIVSYSQELTRRDSIYRLPLRGLPEIERLGVEALVGTSSAAGGAFTYNRRRLEQQKYVPDRDFEVALESEVAGLRNRELVLARVRPELDTRTEKIGALLVLFDTSASRALGFTREVEHLGELVAALAAAHGSGMHLAVATFDQVVTPVFEGEAADFGRPQLDAILARRPLGASNLHGALTWAGKATGYDRVVVVTDGIATAGPSETDALRTAAAGLRGSVERLDVVLVGGIRDFEAARKLVAGTLERDGVVLDGTLGAQELAAKIGHTTLSGIAVSVAGAEWVWPERLDGVQPGDEVLVYAGLGKNALASGRPVDVHLSGPIDQHAIVPLQGVTRPLLERSAAGARIARLAHQRDGLAAGDRAMRDRLRDQIVELSTRYRVLSDFTALLVLETEDDYARFGIDRRGLAEIMTVGKKGIEVFSRAQPVVIARDPEPRRGATDKTKKKPAKEKAGEVDDPGAVRELERSFDDDDDDYKDTGARGDQDGDGVLDVADELPAPPPETPGPVSTPRPSEEAAPEADQVEGALERLEVTGGAAGGVAGGAAGDSVDARSEARAAHVVARPPAQEPEEPKGPPPYTGKMADIMASLSAGASEKAVIEALAWRSESPGDVMALVALGAALEARGNYALAARAYGSIIDLFPSRADMRRFAAERLERLGASGANLAADSFAKAVTQRPDHLTGHRLLAYALVRAGRLEEAFGAIEDGLGRTYPSGRFAGGVRILREDLGIIAAAWLKQAPEKRAAVLERLRAAGVSLATKPSLRFVLNWETDANDVDFHIHDGKGGHAFYSQKELPSGGALYEDVTTGYGPECFTIEGRPTAYPYKLQIHYYSRGPMGYGMGKLEIMEHDGKGNLRFDLRPFVVMNDGAFVDLGVVEGSGSGAAIAK